ncbi:5-formyltetrahydrofolate cyclo-ligase [Chitinimonas sp. JJ19]|uniref:5-formyltetrahydrofolate cyclo-ligase n=1 Tax=Chitinimonas sp. JJ19 TaxID=3109352 RepID=UPI003002C6E7
MTDKATLRRQLRRRRMAVPAAERERAERLVAARLRPLLRRGMRLAAYVALGSELSLAPLISLAQARGVAVYLPVVPRRGRRMRFAALADPQGVWRRNRYGIREYHARKLISARALDLVLLPLVGFDAQGGRLGQGGGYYDTTFAFRAHRQQWKKPRLWGVGFECQRVAAIPREPHDAPLDGVVSEAALYRT